MMTESTLDPIRVDTHVPLAVDAAFRLFTDRMETWWPVEHHSVGEDRVAAIVFETREGGELYERWHDGTTHHWARVLEWDPPARLVLAWHVNPERQAPTEIVVEFVRDGSGTRVTIEHRAWERLGAVARQARESYSKGWVLTLERFGSAAGREAGA